MNFICFRFQNYSAMPCNAFNAEKPVMGNVMYMFYLSKILDFFDTVFIILGKKWKQLSFLHVYHHLTIFAVWCVYSLPFEQPWFILSNVVRACNAIRSTL